MLDQFPIQGEWTVERYLKLPEDGRLIEYNEGVLEIVPLPDWIHQHLAALLWMVLRAILIDGKKGEAILPPFHLRTDRKKYRHPDVMYLAPQNLHRFDPKSWDYADLVIEIVSPDDPDRDYIEKRTEYAAAGVPEYWIIDPDRQRVTQLTLDAGTYRETAHPIRSTIHSTVLAEIVVDLGSLYEQASTMPGQG